MSLDGGSMVLAKSLGDGAEGVVNNGRASGGRAVR